MSTYNIQFLDASRSIIIMRATRSMVKRAVGSVSIRTTNCKVFPFTPLDFRFLLLLRPLLHFRAPLRFRSLLKVRLATHDLGGVNGIHLGRPALRRHNFAHSSHFVRRVTRNTDVVVALENDLDITNVKLRRVA